MTSFRPMLSPSPAPKMPMAPDMTLEELKKRDRAREYARKTYKKKKGTIDALRQELQELETQYQELLNAQQSHSNVSAVQSEDVGAGSALLLQRYKQVTALKQRLYAENEALFEITKQNMMGEAAVQVAKDMMPSVFQSKPRYEQLPYEFYLDQINSCKQDAGAFFEQSPPRHSGMQLFGWTDHRSIQDDNLEFAFQKTFTNISAYETMQRTWSWLVNEETRTKVYSASMRPTVIKLQDIDDHSMLFYWSLKPSGVRVTFKSVFILARRAVQHGFMIMFRSVSPVVLRFDQELVHELYEQPDDEPRSVYWATMNNWAMMWDDDQGYCHCQFGGGSKASLWAIEMLLICMRWENFVIGPRRLLPPSSPTSK